MLFLNENNIVTKPEDLKAFPVPHKNAMYARLEKGTILFLVPKDFPEDKNPKHLKNVYKVGFIYDCLTIMYPDYGKEKKHSIISNEYHFDLSYRRFKTILDDYERQRESFINARHLLKLCE